MISASDFNYLKPENLNEAVKIKGEKGAAAIVLAGGGEIINRLRSGEATAETVIDLKGIGELGEIAIDKDILNIGALVTFSDILDSETIRNQFPLLWETAAAIGSVSVRNRAGEPYRDSAPALLVYDAMVMIQGPGGKNEISLSDWFIDPKKCVLADDQIVTGIKIPRPAEEYGACYLKLKRYDGQDFGQASVAIMALADKQYRIAFGSVGPLPIRAEKIEALLAGKDLDEKLIQEAVKLVPEEISPQTDIRATAEYREHMSGVMLKRGLRAAAARLTKGGPDYGTRLI
ncbi:MAG: hypothetical protein AVO39_11780 [delta proteobacterium MLS_D]|nr:MAG: hypothetical protein AVO39_11780 [delta proteobacterium MLS_D]